MSLKTTRRKFTIHDTIPEPLFVQFGFCGNLPPSVPQSVICVFVYGLKVHIVHLLVFLGPLSYLTLK